MTVYRRTTGIALLALAAAATASCAGQVGPDPTRPGPTSSGAAAGAVGPTATATDCPGSGLAVTAGVPDAAMGLRALAIDLTNCGSRPYTVNGYPTVRVLDDGRKPLDVRTSHGASAITTDNGITASPAPVTLAPGQRATATLVWRNLVTDATVVATRGTYLEIVPAPGEPAQTVAPHDGIDLGNTGMLGVGAWAAARPTATASAQPASAEPAIE
ncbi:hypothetical protein GCM10023322_83880 [Rugosimonospora acidiphila]|uniref:DUF4232 domain-containing protein n=1 Tax=Rugosimonospora acidiphila TaxID=556531 RepID=A0ABP9SW61_9ACTN